MVEQQRPTVAAEGQGQYNQAQEAYQEDFEGDGHCRRHDISRGINYHRPVCNMSIHAALEALGANQRH